MKTVAERYESLTPRERQVCNLMVSGLSTKDVARRLRVQPDTIRDHVSVVLNKMRSENRVTLTRETVNVVWTPA